MAITETRPMILCGRCLRVHDPDRTKHYHKHEIERCEHCGMLMETELPKCCDPKQSRVFKGRTGA